MYPRALITDKVHPMIIDGLSNLGWKVDYDIEMDNQKLHECIHLYQGIIINSKIKIDKEKIDKASQLNFIARLGSGLEIIDVKYAEKKKIKVINSPEGNCNAVAEHEMGMILALANNLIRADREVRSFKWEREKNRGFELRGKTIGIIGIGHTGTAFAEKLSPWRLKVITYDKYKDHYSESLRFTNKVSLKKLQAESDIISLHLPYNQETHYFIDEDFLSKCKHGVIISNTSRGSVIDTAALIQALKSGKVGGACMDVFENENPDRMTSDEKKMYDELYAMQNVVLSPHIAGWTHESLILISKVLLDKIMEHLKC